MSVVIILMLASLAVGLVFLSAFVWSVRSGQYEDTLTPAMRVLLDDAATPAQSPPAGAHGAPLDADTVAQTSQSAASQVSKPAGRTGWRRAADLEIGDSSGWETCATKKISGAVNGLPDKMKSPTNTIEQAARPPGGGVG